MRKHDVSDFVDLTRLPKAIQRLIRDGKPRGERSDKGDFRVVCAMVENNYSDEEICAVFLNTEFGISSKTLEQRKPEDYLRRTIAKARSQVDSTQSEPVADWIVLPLDVYLKHEFPPRVRLLGPWLHHPGLYEVFAARGVGKTHFALGVAYAVASGGSFLTWTAPEAKRVLYIDGEMPGALMQKWVQEIATTKNVPLKIMAFDVQPGPMPDLALPEHQEKLRTYTRDADLIIVDSLATLCRSYTENDADSWTPMNNWLLQMRREGRTVIFLHHTNKLGGQRGSIRKEDNVEDVIELKHPPGWKPQDGLDIEIHTGKGREVYGEDAAPIRARLRDGEWTIEPVVAAQRRAEAVTHHRAGKSNKEIANIMGIGDPAVSKYLSRARELGEL